MNVAAAVNLAVTAPLMKDLRCVLQMENDSEVGARQAVQVSRTRGHAKMHACVTRSIVQSVVMMASRMTIAAKPDVPTLAWHPKANARTKAVCVKIRGALRARMYVASFSTAPHASALPPTFHWINASVLATTSGLERLSATFVAALIVKTPVLYLAPLFIL